MEILSDETLENVNRNLRLIRKKRGLTFGTDAFLLSAYLPVRPKAWALELGGGTGIVSLLALSAGKCAHVTALEIQSCFCDMMRRSGDLNGMSDLFEVVEGDVRNAPLEPESFDLVFTNPPYMKCDSGKRNEYDEKNIARHEVCGEIADFCRGGARFLKYGGRFVVVYRPDRLSDLMAALRAAALEPKRMTFVHADESSAPCMVLVEARKGSACGLAVTPPLFLYTPEPTSPRTYTKTAAQIYETCSFPEV